MNENSLVRFFFFDENTTAQFSPELTAHFKPE